MAAILFRPQFVDHWITYTTWNTRTVCCALVCFGFVVIYKCSCDMLTYIFPYPYVALGQVYAYFSIRAITIEDMHRGSVTKKDKKVGSICLLYIVYLIWYAIICNDILLGKKTNQKSQLSVKWNDWLHYHPGYRKTKYYSYNGIRSVEQIIKIWIKLIGTKPQPDTTERTVWDIPWDMAL